MLASNTGHKLFNKVVWSSTLKVHVIRTILMLVTLVEVDKHAETARVPTSSDLDQGSCI